MKNNNLFHIFILFLKRIISAFKMLGKRSLKAIFIASKVLLIIKPLLFIKSFRFLISPLLKWLFGGTFLVATGIIDLGESLTGLLQGLGIFTFLRGLFIVDYIKKANIKIIETVQNLISN